ncbi:MAG: hypothetical protein DLM69_00465, partial [Candidatus Chloroheliales bacterium]
MAKYKFLLPVLMLALVVSTLAGMLGNVAASPVSSPALIAQSSQNTGNAASASGPAQAAQPPASGAAIPANNDGLDALPPGLRGVSYSTLAMSGKVHPAKPGSAQPNSWVNPFAPLLNITWGAAAQTTASSSGEPAAGVNPTNGQYLLVSGNFSLDNSTNGGLTWQTRTPPNPHGSGDVTNAWLEGGAGGNALEMAINNGGGGYDFTCGRSTDFGVNWATDAACGASVSTPYFDDREYIWVDHNPASPFYGRAYVTVALFDAGGSGSFNTVSNRWSSDNGTTWNPPGSAPLALVPNNEFALRIAHNEFPSLGISPDGTLGYAWHRGQCCGIIVNVPNKVMFARSTDGGVSFPFSTTIVTVPQNQAVSFNSTSPLGVRWSDTPNIAADLGQNGVFYAVWTAYRTPSTPASAAIYLSKSTDNGATWSTPVIPYNNPNPNIFQGWGWVKVTPDGTIHVTFLSGTTNNTTVAQFYVQSTDGGVTWSAPFQLSSSTFGAFSVTTDYEANDVGGFSGGGGTILAAWAQSTHWARVGTFTLGTPTPTVTGTPPTATPTRTNTSTPTSTPTPCFGPDPVVNGGFETGQLAPWVISDTVPPPVVSTAQAHSGTYSALLGTVSGSEPNGSGSIYQQVTVPAGGAQLSYWYYPLTTDTITFDWQDAYVENTSGTILATIMHVDENDGVWKNKTFDMTPYAGQTVRIVFLVHQDGFGDLTSMYVDDVSMAAIVSCGTPTPAPPTATQTNTPVPPTNAPSATSTLVPPTATRTSTAVPPTSTATAVPPSSTPVPATNTPGGPTNTPVPTNTPMPTNTPGGATNTPIAPTLTPTDCPNPFVDINNNVFYYAIHYLYCR